LTKVLQSSYHFKIDRNCLGIILRVLEQIVHKIQKQKLSEWAIPFTAGEEIEQEFFQRFRLLLLLFFPGLNAWRHGECLFPATRVCHF